MKALDPSKQKLNLLSHGTKREAPSYYLSKEPLLYNNTRTTIKIRALFQGGEWFDTSALSFKGEGDNRGEVDKQVLLGSNAPTPCPW